MVADDFRFPSVSPSTAPLSSHVSIFCRDGCTTAHTITNAASAASHAWQCAHKGSDEIQKALASHHKQWCPKEMKNCLPVLHPCALQIRMWL